MSKLILNNAQKKTIKKLVARETNIEVLPNVLSDMSIFYSKAGKGKKICIMELIKRKKIVNSFKNNSIQNAIEELTTLSSDIASLISDFTFNGPNKNYNLTPEKENDIRIDTNIIVIKDLSDHIWKDIHNKFFKKDLKITFVKNSKDLDKISANNFKKANKYDIVFIRNSIFPKFVDRDGKYKNYSSDFTFRFNRVIFSDVDKLNECYCPVANFTWCLTNDKSIYGLDLDVVFFPYFNNRHIWDNTSYYYNDSFYKDNNVMLSDEEEENNITLKAIITKAQTRKKIKAVSKGIKEAHSDNENNNIYLIVENKFIARNSWDTKITKIIKEKYRFNSKKFLESGRNSIVVTKDILCSRTDLNLNFITDIVIMDSMSGFDCEHNLLNKLIVERCTGYGTKEKTIYIQTLLNTDGFFINEWRLRNYIINTFDNIQIV